MSRRRRRKCLNCGELFRPDPRNARHQRYCSGPPCRKASKAASQARWLAKPQNRDYFRGPAHTERVRAWRAANPGYSRRSAGRYKIARRRKPLILLEKQASWRSRRYKRTAARKALF